VSDKNLRFLLFGEDKSASSTFSKTADNADSATNRIGGVFSKMGGAVGGEVGDMLDKIGAGFDKLGDSAQGKLGAKLMAVGGIVAGLGVGMQTMASGDIAAHQQLQAAVDATGKSYQGFDKDVEDAITTQEKYGHKATDTQEALRVMTQAFQDPKAAVEQMSLVENLAAAKHESLAAAAATVAKVHGGSTKILKEFGISVGLNADGTKNYDGALAALSTRLSGQAAAASDTFSGKLAGVRAHLEDVGAQVAGKLGPALTTVGPVILGVGAVMESGMIPATGKAIASFAQMGAGAVVGAAKSVGSLLVVGGGWIASAATATASGVAMAAAWVVGLGPVAWIIAAVAAIGAALVLAYNKVSWFHDGVNAAWDGIKVGVSAAKDWVIGAWAAVTGFFESVPARFAAAGQTILHGIETVFSWTPLGLVVDHWGAITAFFGSVPSKIGSALGGVGGAIEGAFRAPFNLVATMWNRTVGSLHFDIPSWVPGLGGHGFDFPHIPTFATGISNFPGGLAWTGENGPELLNLPSGTRVNTAQQSAAMAGKGSGNGGALVHIENYNDAHQPPNAIAAEWAFLARNA
jgi:hypothetical protein